MICVSDVGQVALIAVFVVLLLSGVAAHERFLGRGGGTRRGFKVAAQTLPSEVIPFVRSLADGYSHEQHAAFILRRGSAVLVQPVRYPNAKNLGLPLVGFIDLNAEPLVIEYRLSACVTVALIALLAALLAVAWIEHNELVCTFGLGLFFMA
jgi:hypothetical protein